MTDRSSAYDLEKMEAEIRKEWNALTDEDLPGILGSYDDLIASIQKRYGVSRAEAERQVEEWHRRFEKSRP